MNTNLITSDFKSDLINLWNTRSKNISKAKNLHRRTQIFIENSHEVASTVNYGITITFPEDTSCVEAWNSLESRICGLKKTLSDLPVYAALISIEIHKKKNNGVKLKKINPLSLGGKPHVHVLLILYNDFICPSNNFILEKFCDSDLYDVEMRLLKPDNSLSGFFNVKNWFMYCIKELKDNLTQDFLVQHTNFTSSCTLFWGHKKSRESCEKLSLFYKKHGINMLCKSLNIELELPLVPYMKSEALKVSIFLKGLLEQNNICIWEDKKHLCKLIPGAKATWERGCTLSNLYSYLIKVSKPKTQELLINSSSFNLYLRDYHKLNFNWLPQVNIDSRLIELQDGIYEFQTGRLSNRKEWGLTSCASYWLNHSFNSLPWPEVSISVVERMIASEFDCEARGINFIIKFAEMFHDKKQNDQIIYLWGMPGSGKSALVEAILRAVAGPKVGFVSSYKSRFQMADLIDKDIAILNEFSVKKIKFEEALLLTEGSTLMVDKKFSDSKMINGPRDRKMHAVAISNEEPPRSGALKRRLDIFYLKKKNFGITRDEEISFDEAIQNEAVAFCILSNIVYFHSKGLKPSIPRSWLKLNKNNIYIKKI